MLNFTQLFLSFTDFNCEFYARFQLDIQLEHIKSPFAPQQPNIAWLKPLNTRTQVQMWMEVLLQRAQCDNSLLHGVSSPADPNVRVCMNTQIHIQPSRKNHRPRARGTSASVQYRVIQKPGHNCRLKNKHRICTYSQTRWEIYLSAI